LADGCHESELASGTGNSIAVEGVTGDLPQDDHDPQQREEPLGSTAESEHFLLKTPAILVEHV
jgi:hypothetical protein